ncbi:hypothetical protein B7486_49510 [cyanobacterium TDX16]|nr:hypothetical protein B7486_49510 [cyanobacterium TDX16]
MRRADIICLFSTTKQFISKLYFDTRSSMIIYLEYTALSALLLAALIGAIAQMGIALDEANLERFFVWTCIASVIAYLPMVF